MQLAIEDIKVKKRIRKEMGDIAALADSMRRFGQISPIVVSKHNVLIAGGRRLEAAKALGWTNINVIVAEVPDELTRLEYELEENLQRRDFTADEADDAAQKIERLRNPSFFRRIIMGIKRFFTWLFRIKE
ncbi:MAG: ParB/RepB/Spo0J family partition protein [Treponema sp.]|nr:ParB/RepB/Spo0J family partition protein [Treponema sp.]